MAGICSLLFVVAVLIGYFGIKEKLAKQRELSTMKPSTWSGCASVPSASSARLGLTVGVPFARAGKQAAAGQKLSATGAAARGSGASSSSTKANNSSVGAHSSLFGGGTSDFDSAGYADLEMEDRQQQGPS